MSSYKFKGFTFIAIDTAVNNVSTPSQNSVINKNLAN